METGETGRIWGLGRLMRDVVCGGASRREMVSSSEVNEFTEWITPLEALRAAFFSLI